ncbi:hypothetical protein E2562_003151 [Oryza meyeriana var. granulata]|uniref:Uncharacterized protein n=1 Tax=Oryza meyeriana var. granulata TaxID=110450 RepID=A0A6G1EUM0_9ORYZ|nr:hypothetical protein E2562_003151 [Oryza meyeriana var. granulata]
MEGKTEGNATNMGDWKEWLPYVGEDYVPSNALKKTPRGRRKRKFLRNNMDVSNSSAVDKYAQGDFDDLKHLKPLHSRVHTLLPWDE